MERKWWKNAVIYQIDQMAKEPDKRITINGPKLHEYIRELSKETFQK